MRRKRREQLQESFHHGQRPRLPGDRLIHKDHHRRNGGVETHPIEVFRDLFDARVQRLHLCGRGRHVFDGGVELDQIQQFLVTLCLGG